MTTDKEAVRVDDMTHLERARAPTEVKPLSDETPQVVTVGGIIRWYEDQLAALKSENEKLREALEAFLVRWDECLPSIQNAEKIAHIHGWKYSGPAGGMVDVANAARAALAKG